MINSLQLQRAAIEGNYNFLVEGVKSMRRGESVILYSQPVSKDNSQVDMEVLYDQLRIKLGRDYGNYHKSISNANGEWRLGLQRK